MVNLGVNRVFAALASAVLISLTGLSQPTTSNFTATGHLTSEASQLIGETNAIVGKVAEVAYRPAVTFLNLDKLYPNTPFRGVIFAEKTNQFGDLGKLRGRTVLISGKINLFHGKPEVVLDNTNQLEVLDDASTPVGTDSARLKEPPGSATAGRTATPVQPTPSAGQTDASAHARDNSWGAASWWIAGALVSIAILLGWLVVSFQRSVLAAPRALMPASMLSLPPGTETDPGNTLRALAASALSEPGAEALREKIASDLTAFAKQRLVQGLYSQRKELADTQQKAAAEMSELEERLERIHAPLQDRLQAYEARINELEKELARKGEENRELIKAKIQVTQKQMAAVKGRMDLN